VQLRVLRCWTVSLSTEQQIFICCSMCIMELFCEVETDLPRAILCSRHSPRVWRATVCQPWISWVIDGNGPEMP
jgi:hypothetical protein